jgi:geranylgeranyl pyrophosphate synthase
MTDLNTKITAYQDRANISLEKYLQTNSPSRLMDAVRYSVLNGGKRLRSVLVYMSSELGNAESNTADITACSVELIHCYSLIHDDLPAMDDDDLRRGVPTCHVEFDEATAILAGDALQPMAYELICSIDGIKEESKVSMVHTLSSACGPKGMVEGQMRDVHSNDFSELEDLNLMHRLKTGKLIEASLKLGAIVGGLKDSEISILVTYGEKIGLAFQIRDDVIDIESSSKESGKPQGSDILKEKVTYPSLVGLKESKRISQRLAEEASDIISPLGIKGNDLKDLAFYLVNRTN